MLKNVPAFRRCGTIFGLLIAVASVAAAQGYTPEQSSKFLKQYCLACHQGKAAVGGLDVSVLLKQPAFDQKVDQWTAVANRVRGSEMPPKGAPMPPDTDREEFTAWVKASIKDAACAAGITPGRYPARRLNRSEYSATVRDLLNIHLDVGASLPVDGAGGEGFDNAAETLFLSPVHAEKYLEAAKLAVQTALGDDRTRDQLISAHPGPGVTPRAAARKIFSSILPRAFRHPVTEADIEIYVDIFDLSQKRKETFERSIGYALQAVLISPDFLFRHEPVNSSPDPRLVDNYSLASRLSYFLWGTMPDGLLFDLAGQGKLNDPEVLKWQIARMMRNPKSLAFTERFVDQWLGTRELGRSVRPDAKLFPEYEDEELRSDIRYQPIMFFHELTLKDLSLLNLIDSEFTFTTRKLQKLYGLKATEDQKQTGMPQRFQLPEGSDRGGVLGMSAILAVSSHPHRTSPVLRGKWLLDALLGTPPPPPPPDVPELKTEQGATPKTLREMLTQHRENPVCASCHSRIDPLGFALENYDVLGRWRTTDAGQPIDAQGEMPDGTSFDGPKDLKRALMDRKDLLIRHLTSKMLGYALGRGLTVQDSCTVDEIVTQLEKENYGGQTLIRAIVFSMPFRYQAGRPVEGKAVSKLEQKTETSR